MQASRAAEGSPVVIQFRALVAEIVDSDALLGGQIVPGSVLTGNILYRRESVSESPLSGIERQRLSVDAQFVIQAGALLFRSEPLTSRIIVEVLSKQQNPRLSADTFIVRSQVNAPLPGGVVVDEICWQIDDPSGNAFKNRAFGRDALKLTRWQSTYGLTIEGHGPAENTKPFFIRAHMQQVVLP